MLSRMGFHNLWIAWIKGCLESATLSLLVNGSPTEEFKPTRGLRQGDPLAPASKTNLLTGLKIGKEGDRGVHPPICG